MLDIEKFDMETQRRIAESIAHHKNGDTSNLIEIGTYQQTYPWNAAFSQIFEVFMCFSFKQQFVRHGIPYLTHQY